MKRKSMSPGFITAFFMGIVCLVLVLSHAARSDVAPINVTRVIDRDHILLSDVFSDIPKSKDVRLGASPRPGSDMILNMRLLIKLATAHGITFHPTSPDDQIILKRFGNIITEEKQKEFIKYALTPYIQGKFDVHLNSTLSPIYTTSTESDLLKIGDIQFGARKDTFETTLISEEDKKNIQPISGRIERLIDVPVPRTNLVRGTIISQSDFDVTEIKSTDLKGDTVMNTDQIIGRVVRNNLTQGRLIRLSDTEIPMSIKRGQKVNLVYRVGSLELTAIGRSMQDGRVGDIIRVTNGDSNKNLQGTILADNQVEIDP